MYQLGEVIGRGATGVVHRSQDPVSGRALAVKVLHAHLVGDAKATSRFIQERHVLSRVSHPNVVSVIELVAEGDQLSIVMELVDGGDLKQLHQRARPRPSEAVAMVARIADALAALHAAGVVHRDLKPANVLIEETADGPTPKITDFGLSRLVEEGMSQSSAAVGTPLYMAPEAVERAATSGPPADVYSLGIMLYELLIGEPPFVGGGTMAILRAHAEEVPPMIEGVPAEVQTVVRQTLAKDESARPTAAQIRDRLQAVIGLVDDTVPPRAVPDVSLLESETVTRMRPLVGVGIGGIGGSGGVGGSGSGPGGNRAVMFDDPDMTVAAGSPSASITPSLLVALPERRIGPWPAERVMIAAATALAALVLVGVLVAVKVAGGDKVDPDAFSYAFDPQLVGDGGIATRHWSLSSDGALLTGDLKIFNGGGSPLSFDFVEVLPESLVADVADVRFDPDASELLGDDRAAVLKVEGLDPSGTADFAYTIDLAAGDVSLDRLTELAQDQIAAEKAFYDKQENADREEPEILDITDLSITPGDLNLRVGEEQDLVLAGHLADGSVAPPEALVAAAWSTSDPVVANMVGNRVIPRAAGTATITAQVGDAAASVPILVDDPVEVVAGPVINGGGGGSGGGAASGSGSKADPGGQTTPGGDTGVVTPGTPVTPVTPLDPPGPNPPGAAGTVSVGEGASLTSVNLSWSSPGDNGGAAVDQYEVRMVGGATQGASGTSLTWGGLAYATNYRFEVRAHNSIGWGPWGGTSGGYLTAEAPGRPSPTPVPSVKIDGKSATVTFHSSTCTTAYYHIVGSSSEWISPGWPNARKNGTNCWFDHGHTFTGLAPGSYTVSADLRDTAGSAYQTSSVSLVIPDEITTTFTVTATTDTSVTVAATLSPCAAVTITPSVGAKVGSPVCHPSFTHTFTGLTSGTKYDFTLTGVTEAGIAIPSKTVSGTTKPPTVTPTTPNYDINRDGAVNCGDVDTMTKVDWGTNASRSDLNGDGTVSILDLSKLLSNIPSSVGSCPTT